MFCYNWEKRFIHNKYGWVTMTLSNPNLKWNNGKIPSLFLFLSFQCSWQFLKFVFVFSKQLTVYKTRWWLNLNQGCLVSEWISHQRTLTIAERITVWLVNSLTRLDLTYKENVLFFCMYWSCWIQIFKPRDQPYSDTSPTWASTTAQSLSHL